MPSLLRRALLVHSRTHPGLWHTLGSAFWLGRAIGRRPPLPTRCNRPQDGKWLWSLLFGGTNPRWTSRAQRAHARAALERVSCRSAALGNHELWSACKAKRQAAQRIETQFAFVSRLEWHILRWTQLDLHGSAAETHFQ